MRKLVLNTSDKETAGYFDFLREWELQEILSEYDYIWLWDNGTVEGVHEKHVHIIFDDYDVTGIDFSRCEEEWQSTTT